MAVRSYCKRCVTNEFLGEDNLCEDCRELLSLRDKVKEQNRTISRLLEKAAAQSEHVQKDWLSPYEAAQLKAENKRLREALESLRDSASWELRRRQDFHGLWCEEWVWLNKTDPFSIIDEALNASASGKTRKGGKDE